MQVSVVEELGIPVKFIGVGEAVEDLQPFDAEAFVNAIFSWADFFPTSIISKAARETHVA